MCCRKSGANSKSSSVCALQIETIDEFAFQGEDAKDAFVDFAEGFAADEAIEPFQTQSEFAEGEPSLGGDGALAEAVQVPRRVVLRSVNDSQVFPPAALHCWLDQAAGGRVNPFQRLTSLNPRPLDRRTQMSRVRSHLDCVRHFPALRLLIVEGAP